jgi:hypothetical protein
MAIMMRIYLLWSMDLGLQLGFQKIVVSFAFSSPQNIITTLLAQLRFRWVACVQGLGVMIILIDYHSVFEVRDQGGSHSMYTHKHRC